ncbi:kunitz-type protease inhibitor 1-like [Leucoraja erinacea]|uniref:kunitz-type protease inhibitor 1-like n=1 Tax=Leucoraja erinaceus TaxID=7782 RepID=UPI002455FD24|nr:kunitz-type protease inhibitor 1-like [Leucoraja erinacea]
MELPRPPPLALLLFPLLLLLVPGCRPLASNPQQCLAKYELGRGDFVLDTDDSVAAGASFLSSPNVSRARDCVLMCCRSHGCNVVLLEDVSGPPRADPTLRHIKGCFLFNCLYNQEYVCRFFRRVGFSNFILKEVYKEYLRPRSPGAGDKLPIAKAGGDRIVQPNEEVTLSGLESRDDFNIVKFDWALLKDDPSVKITKTKNRDEVVVSNLKVGVYTLQLTVTDTARQMTNDDVTITVLSPEQSEEYCIASRKVGPCRGSFPRWYYDAEEMKCKDFIYGGCKGNKNNYVDQKECQQACVGVKVGTTPSGRSGLPQCQGECTEQQFKCADNCCIDDSLECDGTQHCGDNSDESACGHLSDRFNRLLDINIPKEKARCTYPPMTGPCRADFSRFYYNPLSKSCERFTFGGCDGNENRFMEESKCMAACRGVTEKDVFSRGAFERQAQESSSNAGIAIAVVLVICIAVVLAVLIFYLLKMKRNRQQASPISSNGSTTEEVKKLMHLDSKPV